MARFADGFMRVLILVSMVLHAHTAIAQSPDYQTFGNSSVQQDACYAQQQVCNRQCGRDNYCKSTVCFEQAVACKRRHQQALEQQLQRDNEQQLREQARENPKTYVLPPVDVCASVGWQGQGYWEFLVTNNCPAAVEVDITFSGGTKANVFCEGYETCKARFSKRSVGPQFNYRLRYVSE
ncbi:MAG: hypothetical protein AseanaTS_05570 [Candidatus Pelagadaptatus aseana]|uniref:hypothetical protein n=1 Tax=Candidatus Pelagadaptatus aseana TaxID=3120508 RepID=UPI0039B13EE0